MSLFFDRLGRAAAPCPLPLIIGLSLLIVAPPALAASLAGQITDPDGRAVGGAHVIVADTLGVVADAVTNSTGTYEIVRLGPGRYHVRVVADGFQCDPVEVTLAEEERVAAHLDDQLAPLWNVLDAHEPAALVGSAGSFDSLARIISAGRGAEVAEDATTVEFTALDLAGTGRAEHGSLLAAVRLAAELARQRRA